MEDSQIRSLIISLLIGLIIYMAGLIVRKNPPEMINSLYGYRTKRSMKNQLLWDEANKYSAELMMRYGMLYALIGSILSLLFNGKYISIVIFGMILVPITLLIIKTEKRLKKLDEEIGEIE
ncbi:SdpI family protein [Paenibacillus sp. An7]|uniref:SdpI family protein n=1 Tax=Paenibacillus sp. An7 TaxID=2689577 RepID=UPI001F158D4B|nr:SdpI family protein [Paenibacillus sp. An7]